jgi:hypothetical protein
MILSIICSYMSMGHMWCTSATCETCLYGMCFETSATSSWNICNILLLIMFQCVYVRWSCLVMQVSVDVTSFMCLTSPSIYSDPWKSFIKFGIKKSHEMISHILLGMAWLSEWNYRSSTKPWKLAQMTLDELYNKSHEGFMLSKCQENTPIDLEP